MVKEFVLITMMTNPMVYTDQKACEEAAQKLLQHDSTAVCIPAGKPQPDNMMGTFVDLIIKLESLGVDSKSK
jgi:hypothetical protein